MRSSDVGEAQASPLLFGGSATPLLDSGAIEDDLEDDQDTGDLGSGIDEDALNSDDLDTDQIASLD